MKNMHRYSSGVTGEPSSTSFQEALKDLHVREAHTKRLSETIESLREVHNFGLPSLGLP